MTFACNLKTGAISLAALISPTMPAAAQGGKWLVHLGPSVIQTDERARVEVGGTTLPGADVRIEDRFTGAIEIARFVTPRLAIGVTAGLPVSQPIAAAGTIAPLGELGRITYGPAAVSVQWHPLRSAAIRPYVGAGIAYLHVFDSDGAAVQDFHLSDDVGPVVQAGFEVPVKSRWSVFVDAKKAFLRTDATGTLGGAPVAARLRMDPLVLHGGLAVRF